MEEEKIVIKKWIVYAIILIIIILSCLNIFTDIFIGKEKKQFKEVSEQLIQVIQDKCESDYLAGIPHTSIYNIKEGISDVSLSITVDNNINGTISVNNDCKVTISLNNGSYKVVSDTITNLTIKKNSSSANCSLVDDELQIGSNIICNEQYFNIIELNEDDIVLLSSYNIDINTNKQDEKDINNPSTNAIAFDKVNNRTNPNNTYCQRTQYGCNIYAKLDDEFTNGTITGTVNEDSTIKPYVDSYALMLDLGDNLLSASLITKEQLETLGCSSSNNDCIMSGYEWLYNTTYWTSSYFEGSPSIVLRVLSGGFFGSSYANYDNNTGLRPVITITRSSIDK